MYPGPMETNGIGAGLEIQAAVAVGEQAGSMFAPPAPPPPDVTYLDEIILPFAAVPAIFAADLRPKDGWVWAVQRLTVSGFGALTDFVTVYRANSVGETVPNKAVWTFQEAVAGGVSTWHPGRTGLILKAKQGLAVGGTFTGTNGFLSIDVIQVALADLPAFLI